MASLDIQQLQKSLEPYLSKAIAATCVAQPADPVEFLALHLKHQLNLNDTVYKDRKSQQTKIDRMRNEEEQEIQQQQDKVKAEQQQKLEQDQQKQQEKTQQIQEIFQQYKQEIDRIQSEADEIDPDEEEGDNAEANGEDGEAPAEEEEGENAEEVDEELQEEINDLRVQLIVSKRKIQQARDCLKKLQEQGLITPFREALQANSDGTPIPPSSLSPQVFTALKALQILFDRPKKDMKVYYPNGLRRYIPLQTETLLRQISQYDPNQNQRRLKFRRAKQYIASITDKDALAKENAAAAVIADFVQYCCESRKYTKKLQSLKKQEVETIPEDETDPQTDSELEYVDSEDEKPEEKEENGEENGEDDEEEED